MTIEYGITTPNDGNMIVHEHGVSVPLGAENREKFFDRLNVRSFVTAKLVHGHRVQRVSQEEDHTLISDTDGLITNTPELFLATTVADCFPVYVWDNTIPAIGIAHAGWRGIVTGIAPTLIQQFQDAFHSSQDHLMARIGPGICADHYEIQRDMEERFHSWPQHVHHAQNRMTVDLRGILQDQLTEAGISPANFSVDPGCTYEDSKRFFSYRRTRVYNVMMAYIGIRKP